jgi:hypothetical protein
MKTIITRIQKSSRPGVILLATVVAIITCMTVANATQTITTPNAASISYSLATGGTSAPITPVTNKSVLVMGCCTTGGDQGSGHVSLVHIPSGAIIGSINWTGVESFNPFVTTANAITGGFTSNANIHVVYIDAAHAVDIKTASADTILVHNSAAFTVAGNVTLIW